MADKIQKLLAKLPKKDLLAIRRLIARITAGDLKSLNVSRLKGHKNIYRARKGNFRVVYSYSKDGKVKILSISRRNEKAYRDY